MDDMPVSLRPLRRACGVFLFLALSGLVPFLARYGVFSQWILLVHIFVGVLAVAPLSVIFWKHGRAANAVQPTRSWSPGLWSGLGWAALSVSGLWLVGKGIWGVFVPYQMHYFHVVAGIVLGTVGLFHVGYGLAKSNFVRTRYVDLVRPVSLWVIVFTVGAALIFFARREGDLAVANFSPSN